MIVKKQFLHSIWEIFSNLKIMRIFSSTFHVAFLILPVTFWSVTTLEVILFMLRSSAAEPTSKTFFFPP